MNAYELSCQHYVVFQFTIKLQKFVCIIYCILGIFAIFNFAIFKCALIGIYYKYCNFAIVKMWLCTISQKRITLYHAKNL